MCDGKANSTVSVDTTHNTPVKRTYHGLDKDGNPIYTYEADGKPDPNVTDESKRNEYNLPQMGQTSPSLTDQTLRDARANEALRLRARRGRKASFLDSSTDWSKQDATLKPPTGTDGINWDPTQAPNP